MERGHAGDVRNTRGVMGSRENIFKELRTIPGVGEAIAEDFLNLGIRRVLDLKGKSPEKLYRKLCELERRHIDRCMLYVMRCAVYFASHKKHNPKLLLWWNWKDKK